MTDMHVFIQARTKKKIVNYLNYKII